MKALRQNCSLEVIGNANANRDSRQMCRINALNATGTVIGATSVAVREMSSGSGINYGRNKTPCVASANLDTNTKNLNYYEDDGYLFDSPSNFVLGFDISKSNYSNEFELSGQDLTKSSGLIQVNLNFDGNPRVQQYGATNPALTAVNLQAIVVVKHKRILDIGLDSSQVIY